MPPFCAYANKSIQILVGKPSTIELFIPYKKYCGRQIHRRNKNFDCSFGFNDISNYIFVNVDFAYLDVVNKKQI